MIEPIMFFAMGFLVASLFGLVLIPLVHNRAVRLTMRRLEAATPLSMAEIQADKDQLRAEFAMSTRRLELSVEQMKARTTNQLTDLGKKSEAIGKLKTELGEKSAAIFALEARERALKEQLQTTEAEHAMKVGSLREAERMLTEKQGELNKLAIDLNERAANIDSQRIETTALRVQVEALKARISDYERDAENIGDRMVRERKEAAEATAALHEERGRVEKLSDRVVHLERALVVQTTEAEVLGRRVQELEGRVAEQSKALSGRELEMAQLRDTITAARKTETDLRQDLAGAAARARAASEGLVKEKALIEDQLAQSKAERARLQQDMASMKRDAEQTWAAERIENALLRERINDIAAEIARLTIALEGKDSPIDAMLAAAPVVANGATAGSERIAAEAEGEPKGSLADRIRSLQTKASRAPARAPN
jgi:chromosome segregation ATPase